LRSEPAWIIQARGSDGDNFRIRVGLNYNRRAAIGTKAPTRHTAPFTRRWMETWRALQKLERFRSHDDVRRKRPSTGSLAIPAVAMKHQNRFGCGLVANRAASASTCEWCLCFGHIFYLYFNLQNYDEPGK